MSTSAAGAPSLVVGQVFLVCWAVRVFGLGLRLFQIHTHLPFGIDRWLCGLLEEPWSRVVVPACYFLSY